MSPELVTLAHELGLDQAPPESAAPHRTSLHEAGHVVVACLELGVRFTQVSVLPDERTTGRTLVTERGADPLHLAIVALGGPASDLHFAGYSAGYAGDLAIALTRTLDVDAAPSMPELFRRAREIVERRAREIELVADRLDELGRLLEDQVARLLGVTLPPRAAEDPLWPSTAAF